MIYACSIDHTSSNDHTVNNDEISKEMVSDENVRNCNFDDLQKKIEESEQELDKGNEV